METTDKKQVPAQEGPVQETAPAVESNKGEDLAKESALSLVKEDKVEEKTPDPTPEATKETPKVEDEHNDQSTETKVEEKPADEYQVKIETIARVVVGAAKVLSESKGLDAVGFDVLSDEQKAQAKEDVEFVMMNNCDAETFYNVRLKKDKYPAFAEFEGKKYVELGIAIIGVLK